MTRSSRQGKFVKKNLSAIQPSKPGEAIEVIKKVLQDLSVSVEGIQRRTTSLEFGLDGAESDYDSESTSASDLIDEAQEGILALTGDADELEARVAQAETDIDDLEGDVATLTTDLGTVTSQVSTNTTDIASVQGDVGTLTTNLSAVGSQVSTNTSDISGLVTAVDDLNVLVGSVQGDVATNAGAISVLETDVGTLETTVAGHTSTLSTHTTDIQKNEDDIDAIESVITGIQSDVTSIESDIATIQGDITAIEADVVTIEAGIVALQRCEMDHFIEFTASRWPRWLTGTAAGTYPVSAANVSTVSSMAGPGFLRITGGTAASGQATCRFGIEQQIILTDGFEVEFAAKVSMNSGGGVFRFGFGRITIGVVPSANPLAYAELNAGAGSMSLFTDNGTNTATDTDSYAGVNISTGSDSIYRLRVNGTALELYIDGSLVLAASDYVPVNDRTKSLSYFMSVDNLTSIFFPTADLDWVRMGVV